MVALSGTGTAVASPKLTLSASSLSLGSEAVNTPKSMTLTLTSSGTSAVKVTSDAISGTGFTIVGDTLPATLNPNQTLALQVQFKPTAYRSRNREAYCQQQLDQRARRAAVALSGHGNGS